MKKILAMLMALSLAFAPASYAAVELTDAQMSDITAGDWVIYDPDTEAVADVYHTNNTLDLADESQMELQAVSNANAVDSAIAVQTNITSVSGQEPSTNIGINGSNTAHITNYAPANSGSEYERESFSAEEESSFFKAESEQFNLTETSSEKESYTLTETLDIKETLDILYAAASATETECKNCESSSVSAEALLVDFDYDLNYDKNIAETEEEESRLDIAQYKEEIEAATFEAEISTEKEESESYRYNHGRNNHIDLEDTAQKNLQAVSNLNAVASGAAVQTNIASNVGVGGTITHSNIATVVSGL